MTAASIPGAWNGGCEQPKRSTGGQQRQRQKFPQSTIRNYQFALRWDESGIRAATGIGHRSGSYSSRLVGRLAGEGLPLFTELSPDL
jgi:hypothetical protein